VVKLLDICLQGTAANSTDVMTVMASCSAIIGYDCLKDKDCRSMAYEYAKLKVQERNLNKRIDAISQSIGYPFTIANECDQAVTVGVAYRALDGKRYASYWNMLPPHSHKFIQRVAADHVYYYASVIDSTGSNAGYWGGNEQVTFGDQVYNAAELKSGLTDDYQLVLDLNCRR
jgi:hypothetical protein